MRVLLIDDCEEMGYLVNVSLKPFEVDQAFSLAEARQAIMANTYNLLLIDVTLPDGNGFKFCQELTKNLTVRSIPKIILTAKTSTSDKVFGLNCGADDYVTKPFDPPELKARVDLKLRHHGSSDSFLRCGCFQFEPEFQRCLVVNGKDRVNLQLTPTEFRLFWSLAKREGIPLSRHELASMIWKAQGSNIEIRGIDAHIRHLRRKLGRLSTTIISVYGKGYTFKLSAAT